MDIVHQWGPQAQGDPTFDLPLDFPFDLDDFGLGLSLDNLGLTPPHTATSGVLHQPIIHPTLTPQRIVGLHAHPSPSLLAGSSAAVINRRDLGLLLGNPNIPTGPIPMTSGVAPAMGSTPASSSSLIGANPVTALFGSSTGAPMQIVRPWNPPAGSSMGPTFAAPPFSANAGPSQAPIFHCACVQHGHPLVRVHDTVEWVRPDLMKMSVYFNFSPNAAAQAHSSWERRDA